MSNHPAGSDHPAGTVAQQFIDAVVWGEHVTVWELLSPEGRDLVLAAGAKRGMDAIQAERLRQGTSSDEERDVFLTGLLHGLRVDFSSVELGKLVISSVAEQAGTVEVQLESPATFGDQGWAAGSVLLSRSGSAAGDSDGSGWLVDRLKPLVTRSE